MPTLSAAPPLAADRPAQVLLVEDDAAIGAAVVEGLQREGFTVQWQQDGASGYAELCAAPPQLLILDWMLPHLDGVTLLRQARAARVFCPTLFLTARDQVADRVAGLDAGADDYLCKPFAFSELLARVRALMRRQVPATRLQCADLYLDTEARTVTRGDQAIALSDLEYTLLEFLMRHVRETIPRDMLAREVWKVSERATPIQDVIDAHVGRLRRKLEIAGQPPLLHQMTGIGVCLSDREPW